MALLKKSDILLGIDEPRKIEIVSLGGEIYLRPLSSAEMNKVIGIEAEGYGNFEATNTGSKDPKASAKMNLAKMNKKAAESKYEAVYLSINNPKNEDEWSLDEIHSLHQDQIEELYSNIMRISGAETTTNDVKKFPEN